MASCTGDRAWSVAATEAEVEAAVAAIFAAAASASDGEEATTSFRRRTNLPTSVIFQRSWRCGTVTDDDDDDDSEPDTSYTPSCSNHDTKRPPWPPWQQCKASRTSIRSGTEEEAWWDVIFSSRTFNDR